MNDSHPPSPSPWRARLVRKARFTIAAFAVPAFFAGVSVSAENRSFAERRDATIAAIAENHEGRTNFAERDRVQFGFHTGFLLAALEADRRGLDNGVSLADAEEQLRTLTETGIRMLGTNEEPGAWTRMALSPALKQAAHVFGFILHQWHDELAEDIRENIRWLLEESAWHDDASGWLVNGRLSIMAGRLFAGEALGYDSDLWRTARQEWETMYRTTMREGGLEMNCPYTIFHYAPLLLLNKIRDERTRNQANILTDNQLMVAGHLYLTGGGVGTPRARDRSGAYGGNTGLLPHYYLLMGEPASAGISSRPHLIGAAGDYEPPAIVGSFFKNKPDTGYEFWTYTPAPLSSRMPRTAYRLGPEHVEVSPWHAIMAPAGNAVMAAAYGHRGFTHHISMGVWVRDGDGRFHRYYHHQPMVLGDTTDIGGRMLGSPVESPDGWRHEGYDYRRWIHGRTLISIWNPTLEHKDDRVVRTHQETRARIPNLRERGGETLIHDGWHINRMGETYIAYRPLGERTRVEESDDGRWIELHLDAHSGCIIEMATTDDFESIREYAEHLAARHLHFESGDASRPDEKPFLVEFDALDPETRNLIRLRLDYLSEHRFINGREVSIDDIDRGYVFSPFIDWDAERQIKTLSRDGYPTVVYDVPNARVDVRD